MRLPLTLAALALSLPTPLLAQSAEPQPEPSQKPLATKGSDNKLICRREAKTGSRMGAARTCLTRQQWEERDEATRRDLRETEGTG